MKKVVLFYLSAALASALLAAVALYLLHSHVGFYWKYKKEKPAVVEAPASFPHLRGFVVVIRKIDNNFLATGVRIATVSYEKDHREVEFFAHLPADEEFKVGDYMFINKVETYGPAIEQSQTMYIARRRN